MGPSTWSWNKRLPDVDEKNLKTLLNEFGSTFLLEDIASAFSEAGRNAELAGQILYGMQASRNVGQEGISSESSNSSGNSRNRDANFGASKTQRSYVSVRGSPSPVKSDKHWVVKNCANSSPRPDRVVTQLDEYEDFLFKMLQHGIRIDRDVIRQVLGECGCDMKKSLEKLIDLAAEKHYSKNELSNEGKIPDRNHHNAKAERTILLPTMRIEESESEEEDGDYNILRKAVKEYRATMNEYYRAATEAYTIGDHARSMMLLEKGELLYRKAREADEQSAKRIYSSSNDEEEDIPLNLEKCRPKEALRLLISHLPVKYIRVINGAQLEDDSQRASRTQVIIKLLESEAINWAEDEDSGNILVSVGEINPQSLSFAKNYNRDS